LTLVLVFVRKTDSISSGNVRQGLIFADWWWIYLGLKHNMVLAGVWDAGKKTEFAGEQVMDNAGETIRRTCCPSHSSDRNNGITRRGFIQGAGGAAVLGSALAGLSWASLGAVEDKSSGRQRREIIVSPILIYDTPQRKHQTSWRNWGGIQTEEDAKKEVSRIEKELKSLATRADFPVQFTNVARVRNIGELSRVSEAGKTDVFIVYAAGGWMDTLDTIANHTWSERWRASIIISNNSIRVPRKPQRNWD
jgi:hypothetical protein